MDAPAPGLTGLYRELWRFADGQRRQLVLAFILLVGSQGFKLAIPALAGTAINVIQTEGVAGLTRAGWLLAAVFGATLASWTLHGPGRILERNVALGVRQRLSRDLMERLFRAPLIWHEGRHGVETAHRVEQSTRALYDFAQSQFIYLQSAASLIGPTIALLVISAWVGTAALTGYVFLLAIIVGFDRVMMRLATAENEANRHYWASLSDGLVNILSVLALRLRGGVMGLIERRLQAVFAPVRKAILYNEAKWASVDLFNTALWIGLVMLYVLLSVAAGAPAGVAPGLAGGTDNPSPAAPVIALGSLFMVYQYALTAGGVITGIAANFQSLARQLTDYRSAAPIQALPIGIAGTASDVAAADPRGQESAPPDWQRLALKAFAFAHPRSSVKDAAERPATLAEVSLDLVRGRHYALIGPSGSGKTTLLRLLAGLYEPAEGRLQIDGVPLEATDRIGGLLRSVATLLPQDADLFGGTVRENLQLASAASTAPALSIAQADEFVARMPEGIDSAVSARGGNLSGGQRQRLAIARALLAAADSSLLLLDEPTSALDPRTEAAVMQALLDSRRDATVIASIHRPQLLAAFDEVIVVNAGRVVAQGRVDDLLPDCAELAAFLRQTGRAG